MEGHRMHGAERDSEEEAGGFEGGDRGAVRRGGYMRMELYEEAEQRRVLDSRGAAKKLQMFSSLSFYYGKSRLSCCAYYLSGLRHFNPYNSISQMGFKTRIGGSLQT